MSESGSRYRTITVDKRLYEDLKNKANELKGKKLNDTDDENNSSNETRINSINTLIRGLFDYRFNNVETKISLFLKHTKEPVLLGDLGDTLNDVIPYMTEYKSVEWIDDINYIEEWGKDQFSDVLKNHIETTDTFKFKKIFIINEEYWDEQAVWQRISDSYKFREVKTRNNMEIYVIKRKKENSIKDVENKYWDMGIYSFGSKNVTGFLDHTRNPYKYMVDTNSDTYNQSNDKFNALLSMVEPNNVIAQKRIEHEQKRIEHEILINMKLQEK